MLAFEPLTYAMGMALAEHALRHPSKICLRTKLWLRRAPDVLLDNALNEAADPLLDALNSAIGQHQEMAVFSFLAVVLVVFLQKQSTWRWHADS